jgi:hypothetical protein
MSTDASPIGAPWTRTDAVRDSLGRLRAIEGLVSACLVEPETGHVLGAVLGDTSGLAASGEVAVSVVAAGASDVVQVIRLMSATLGSPDEVEDVIISLARHHHVLRPLPAAGVDGLFLVVTLDRARTNLALARRQLSRLDPALENPHQGPAAVDAGPAAGSDVRSGAGIDHVS